MLNYSQSAPLDLKQQLFTLRADSRDQSSKNNSSPAEDTLQIPKKIQKPSKRSTAQLSIRLNLDSEEQRLLARDIDSVSLSSSDHLRGNRIKKKSTVKHQSSKIISDILSKYPESREMIDHASRLIRRGHTTKKLGDNEELVKSQPKFDS